MNMNSTRLTDTGNAEIIAHLYGDKIRYDHTRNRWLIWGKHYWKQDNNGQIYRIATKAARERFRQAADIKDSDKCRKVAHWALSSEHRNKLDSAVALAKNIIPVTDSGKDWDNDPWLFAVKNGVINLQTGKLQPGKAEDRITLHSAVNFDRKAKCPQWFKFLSEVFNEDDDLIDYVWRLAGYSMSGVTKEQIYAICYGTGANGKGRFLSALRNVFGDYTYDAPFSTFELYNRATIPNDLAALERRRFVTSSETNEGTRLNEARIKTLSGEDPVTARYLHQEFFTFMPVCKIWLAVNHKPQVKDNSYGFWRRVRLIPFLREFKGTYDDKQLGDTLKKEAPGILNWLIEGCLEWLQRGLSPIPAAISIATEEYQSESDPLSKFIEERCLINPEAIVKAGDLYREYVKWAQEEGLIKADILTSNSFGRRMGTKFNKRHSEHGQRYYGLGILTEYRSGSSSSSISPSIGKEY